MLSKKSKEFRVFFLSQFVKQLIKNSAPIDIYILKNEIEETEKEKKKSTKEIKEKKKVIRPVKEAVLEMEKSIMSKAGSPNLLKPTFPIRRFFSEKKAPLRIPIPQIPKNLQYIRPTPIQIDIDLGKLEPLLRDSIVREIECHGSEEEIIVKGGMGIKKTQIILNEEEIDEIINKFSEKSRIPLHDGVYSVVVGNLVFSAIISEVVNSKFRIKKLAEPPRAFPR